MESVLRKKGMDEECGSNARRQSSKSSVFGEMHGK